MAFRRLLAGLKPSFLPSAPSLPPCSPGAASGQYVVAQRADGVGEEVVRYATTGVARFESGSLESAQLYRCGRPAP